MTRNGTRRKRSLVHFLRWRKPRGVLPFDAAKTENCRDRVEQRNGIVSYMLFPHEMGFLPGRSKNRLGKTAVIGR